MQYLSSFDRWNKCLARMHKVGAPSGSSQISTKDIDDSFDVIISQ